MSIFHVMSILTQQLEAKVSNPSLFSSKLAGKLASNSAREIAPILSCVTTAKTAIKVAHSWFKYKANNPPGCYSNENHSNECINLLLTLQMAARSNNRFSSDSLLPTVPLSLLSLQAPPPSTVGSY